MIPLLFPDKLDFPGQNAYLFVLKVDIRNKRTEEGKMGKERMPWGACENLERVRKLIWEIVILFPVVGKMMRECKKK